MCFIPCFVCPICLFKGFVILGVEFVVVGSVNVMVSVFKIGKKG